MVNHSYCSPKLVINGITYNTLKDFSLDFPGNNQINKLTFTLSTGDIKEQALYGKPLELFLNYGSEDGIPIFRGIIKDINPTTSTTKFTALDVRSLLSGNNTTPLNITDKDNYDGHTLGQFLQKVIQDDYMDYLYEHELESALDADLTSTVGAGDGVQATSNPLFNNSANSAGDDGAVLPMYGQYVTLNDGYSTKTFEFTPDPIANTVISGNIAVLIRSDLSGDAAINATMVNLMDAIETNLHINMVFGDGESLGATPYVITLDGEQRIAGAIGNTSVSQGITANAAGGTQPPFHNLDGDERVGYGYNNFTGGNTGTTTYSGTFTSVPARKGTVKVEVDDMNSGARYIVKGTDTKFASFGDGNAESSAYHASTDISPETKVVSGSIDYELGTYSITFANPIWNGKSIRLAFNQPSKTNKVQLIGTELMNDTNPAVSLTGYRNNKISPYQVLVEKIKEAVDTTDVEKPKEWFIQVREDSKKSNIVFVKRKSRDTHTSTVFSYRDGISSLTYKQRLPPNTGIAAGEKGGRQVFAYSNRPQGIISKDVEITKEYPAEAHKEAIIDIFKGLEEVNNISLSANKLPYIGLESIIDLNIEDDVISGKAIVVQKSIRWSNSKMSLNLKLDRRPIKVSDFIK